MSVPSTDFYFGLLAAIMPAVIAYAGAPPAASRFSFGAAPYLYRMSPSPPSTVALAPSTDTKGWRRRRRTSRLHRLLILPLECHHQQHLRLSLPLERQHMREGSPSGLPLPCQWCRRLLRELRPRILCQRRSSCLGRPPRCLLPPPSPISCCLGIGHALLIRNHNLSTT